jgi:Cu-processing system ATP-binding protein
VTEPFVEIIGVTKHINNKVIVEELNLNIDRGSIVGLCGGNGAGKSTILRIIAGILQPSSGVVKVNQLEWKSDRKQFSHQIGYMPDDYQFSMGLTAEEALSFWAALRRVPKNRVVEVLELVGLLDKSQQQVTTFSKGMRQRLLFAQAMLSNPPLIIMDEPTNGLDPFWMEEFARLLLQIKEQGHVILFSTHQLELAQDVADYVVFLNQGRNVGEGTVDHFRQKYGRSPLHTAFRHSLGLSVNENGYEQ